MKVLSIVAGYFDGEFGRCVVQRYKSLDCIHVNAETLFSKICSVFSEEDFSLANIISSLSDSADYMCGEDEW